MKKLILFLFFILSFNFADNFSQSRIIYVADVEGMVDLGLAPYIRRVIENAEKEKAPAVVIRVNTFGGRVDAATQIKDAILNSKILTIAYVDKRAVSAGALITLSCQKIAMAPGSAMGAATVVNEAGEKMSEKAQAYMRSEMRATAEKNGRRADIAEAMVDERKVIAGLVDSTQLVSLTAEEAVKYGMADTIAASLEDALKYFKVDYAKIEYTESNWSEDFVRFLNHPIITSILLMIGIVGLFTEIKTPGWGLPGTLALIALALFFGSSYILKLATVLDILLFIIGVALLIVEIFFIPGFGIFGILGIILIVGSLFMALITDLPTIEPGDVSIAIYQLTAAFVGSLIIFSLFLKYLPKTKAFSVLVLGEEFDKEKGYVSSPDFSYLIGKIGTTITDLRPSGICLIEDKRYDVLSYGEFIEKNTKVKVVNTEGLKIFVQKTD